MRLLRPLGYLAFLYLVLGSGLLYAETALAGDEGGRQIVPLVVLAVVFLGYNLFSLKSFHHLMAQCSNAVSGFYLANNAIRLLLSVILLLVYGFLVKDGMFLFAINLIVYYLATVIFNSYYCIKTEVAIKKEMKQ